MKVSETSNNTAPINILHHDENILVVQTMAYSVDDDLSAEMLVENTPSFGQFNVGLHVHDEPSHVLENRCQLLNQLNKITDNQVKQINWLNQVHGNTVFDVDSVLDDNNDTSEVNLIPPNADALTTLHQGQALSIMTADCVPIMLYCPKKRRIAGIHAGWHGLANGVIAETVKTFADVSDSHIEAQAWIGACISGENYEVSREVLDNLINGTLENFATDNGNRLKFSKDELIAHITKPHDNPNKAWMDLPKLAKLQLEMLNIKVLTDEVPCSYADTHYYSHRRATHKNQGSTGRMAMIAVIF